MTTQTLVKKLNKKVSNLQKDMTVVRRILFATSRDPEGEYRPTFIRKMLKRISSKGPVYRFTTKEAFLRHVRSSQ